MQDGTLQRTCPGDPLEIGFNPNRITDALIVVGTGKVVIEFKSTHRGGKGKRPLALGS